MSTSSESQQIGTMPQPSVEMANFARQMRDDFTRMMMEYQFGIDEVLTKVTILREEFLHLQKYNPIEHVTSRVKSAESILGKMNRRGIAPSVQAIRENVRDIAGIRITCSFKADTYRVLQALRTILRSLSSRTISRTLSPMGTRVCTR